MHFFDWFPTSEVDHTKTVLKTLEEIDSGKYNLYACKTYTPKAKWFSA